MAATENGDFEKILKERGRPSRVDFVAPRERGKSRRTWPWSVFWNKGGWFHHVSPDINTYGLPAFWMGN